MRYKILDDASTCFKQLYSGGSGWGRSRGVSALAFGDVDGDGRDELAIGRSRGPNMRYKILDDATEGFRTIFSSGAWSRKVGVSALAFGDPDGDGKDELAIGRTKYKNLRYMVRDDANAGFQPLLANGGERWSRKVGVSALAFGDPDADGRDELAVGRSNSPDTAYEILDDSEHAFQQLHESRPGSRTDRRTVSSLAFGSPDDDAGDELAIGWKGHRSYEILDDQKGNYRSIHRDSIGRPVAGLTFGNVDNDTRDELVIGGPTNELEYRIIGDAPGGFRTLATSRLWSSPWQDVLAIDLGDTDGDGRDELAYGLRRGSKRDIRFAVLDDYYEDLHVLHPPAPRPTRRPSTTTPPPTTSPPPTTDPTPPGKPESLTRCTSAGIPSGYFKVHDYWSPTSCGNPTMITENVSRHQLYDNKPVRTTMQICSGQFMPSNWTQVSAHWSPTTCGHPTAITNNVQTVRRDW